MSNRSFTRRCADVDRPMFAVIPLSAAQFAAALRLDGVRFRDPLCFGNLCAPSLLANRRGYRLSRCVVVSSVPLSGRPMHRPIFMAASPYSGDDRIFAYYLLSNYQLFRNASRARPTIRPTDQI